MSGWETFVFEGKSIVPKLAIRKGGQIGLSMSAVERYGLKKYKYIILLINKEEQKIGVKPTNDENEKGARKLKIVQGGASISAKNFIEFYQLNNIKERRLKCVWDEKEKMIVAKYSK